MRAAAGSGGGGASRWMSLAGFLIAALLIWWLLRDEDPAEIWASVRGADFRFLALAVAATTCVFPLRAIRWRYLLGPIQPESPFRSRFAAVCVGFMANNLLPARIGELARAWSYSRLEAVSTVAAVGTLVVERVLDGLVILFLLLVALAAPDFPADGLPPALADGMRGLAIVLASVLAGAVLALALPGPVLGGIERIARALLPDRMADGLTALAEKTVLGMRSLRGWRLLLPAIGWSLGIWLLQSLSFWLGFLAFGIELPFTAAMVTNGATAIAVSIPSAPGFFGTFHMGAAVSLADIYGVADVPTKAFAFGWHLGGFFPITFMGLWYARRIGLSLGEISRRASAAVGEAPGDLPDGRGSGS